MSRVGSKAVEIPKGVDVKVDGNQVKAKGPKGELAVSLPAGISAQVDQGQVRLTRSGDGSAVKALHGTYRSHVTNMLLGVAKGYSRDLEIQGVGYRAQLQGKKLVLNLGYSHPIEFPIPQGITVTAPDQTNLTISGPDKHLVGEVSARLRAFAPAEPYKGKGVRYKGEHVRRKAGKTVA